MGSGMLNRRDFLRVGAAAAVGAVVAGCAQMPGAAPAEGMAAPDEVPQEIRVTWHNQPVYETLNQKFTEETGIEVAMEFHPPKWEEILAKFTLWGRERLRWHRRRGAGRSDRISILLQRVVL